MRKLLLILAMSSAAYGADIKYVWDYDGTDSGGDQIPSEALTFFLYAATDGADPVAIGTSDVNSFIWEQVPLGCHTAWVTAYRSDSDMESSPSNAVEKCVTADSDNDIINLRPSIPLNFRQFWRAVFDQVFN